MGLVIFQNAFCKIMRLFINMEQAEGSSGYSGFHDNPKESCEAQPVRSISPSTPQECQGSPGPQDPGMRPSDVSMVFLQVEKDLRASEK